MQPQDQVAPRRSDASPGTAIHPWVAAGLEDARADRSIVERGILTALDVEAATASRFADAWCMWRVWSRQNWIDCADSPASVTRDRALALPLPGIEAVRARIHSTDSGTIVTSPHMGDYLHVLLKVMLGLSDRKILISRRRPPGELESAVLARLKELGLQCELVVTGPDAALRLARGLRKGGLALIMFDLPGGWGPTTSVPFLGENAGFVAGPATLALRTGAHLIPVGAIQERSGAKGFLGTIPGATAESGAPTSPTNLTATLAADLSRLVRMAPDQWLHWNFLPEFRAATTAMR